MPKRTKMPTMCYDELNKVKPLNETNETKCVHILQALLSTNLTLPEFKILGTYISGLSKQTTVSHTVTLKKYELEQYLGISRLHHDDLQQRLTNLAQTIKLDSKQDNGISSRLYISLFSKIEYKQDENDLWEISLTCSPDAAQHIFNPFNLEYLKNKLEDVIVLTSKYSFILYMYLISNQSKKQWTIPLTEVRTLLQCKADRYTTFKYFNKEVLKKAQKEIVTKTNLKFNYTPLRLGRKVHDIKFTLQDNKNHLILTADTPYCHPCDDCTISVPIPDDFEETNKQITTQQWFVLLAKISDNRFTFEELRVLDALMQMVDKLQHTKNNYKVCYQYFKYIYTLLIEEEKSTPVTNPFAYLKELIEKDITNLQ